MLTRSVTPDEMARQHARFSDLRPVAEEYLEREGVPVEAYQKVAAKKIFKLMASVRPDSGAGTRAAVEIPPGVSVYIVESPPGDGPPLHAHMHTVETFICIRGQFQFNYGPDGEHSFALNEMDFVSLPKGVMRQFINTTDETANLLVLIHEEPGEQALSDLYLKPEVGEAISEKYGSEAKAGLERIGMNFTAGVPEPGDQP